jgi:ABC-type uncharacterized transport system substrate-binding protein
LPGKQLELLLDMVPGANRIGMLVYVNSPVIAYHMLNAKVGAKGLDVELVPAEIRMPADIDGA